MELKCPHHSKIENQKIQDALFDKINLKHFPCIGAKAALIKRQIKCFFVDNMASNKEDPKILEFLYSFITNYRLSDLKFHSAAIIFKNTVISSEEMFEKLMWQRLQSLHGFDSLNYKYDPRVDADPSSPNFSFSLKEEAFFIIGLHSQSSRPARVFEHPTLIFNPHLQFEQLRESGKFEKMKQTIRKRDVAFSGSLNPMLKNFGESSEAWQYSGLNYDDNWNCPLKINHAKTKINITT